MNDYQLVIIGCGLSGLAAGIRFARFGGRVLILEKHKIPGGLNSYYYRKGNLLETGLHAMTNYALPGERHAPLNRLFRQLKLSRRQLLTNQQLVSEIHFVNRARLLFSNDFELLREEVGRNFPGERDGFEELVRCVDAYDPFLLRPHLSSRARLKVMLRNDLLIDMLLWPLMMYGSSEENDMDFSQFVIMFRAIYQEGFFRPAGTIKDLLDLLLGHYRSFGGEVRFQAGVEHIETAGPRVTRIRLSNGQTISCDHLLSTIGYPNTLQLLGEGEPEEIAAHVGRMSFMEFIYLLAKEAKNSLIADRTIVFYHTGDEFSYQRPKEAIDLHGGVICFPGNFEGLPEQDYYQMRVTHPANYEVWRQTAPDRYQQLKGEWEERSCRVVSSLVGDFKPHVVLQDSFTPLTIEKFTGKAQGAVYGSPVKIKDGRSRYDNMFIGGTDQGYLGIVGAMLSGVTVVNQHILAK